MHDIKKGFVNVNGGWREFYADEDLYVIMLLEGFGGPKPTPNSLTYILDLDNLSLSKANRTSYQFTNFTNNSSFYYEYPTGTSSINLYVHTTDWNTNSVTSSKYYSLSGRNCTMGNFCGLKDALFLVTWGTDNYGSARIYDQNTGVVWRDNPDLHPQDYVVGIHSICSDTIYYYTTAEKPSTQETSKYEINTGTLIFSQTRPKISSPYADATSAYFISYYRLSGTATTSTYQLYKQDKGTLLILGTNNVIFDKKVEGSWYGSISTIGGFKKL